MDNPLVWQHEDERQMAIDRSSDCRKALDWVKQSPAITLIGWISNRALQLNKEEAVGDQGGQSEVMNDSLSMLDL